MMDHSEDHCIELWADSSGILYYQFGIDDVLKYVEFVTGKLTYQDQEMIFTEEIPIDDSTTVEGRSINDHAQKHPAISLGDEMRKCALVIFISIFLLLTHF